MHQNSGETNHERDKSAEEVSISLDSVVLEQRIRDAIQMMIIKLLYKTKDMNQNGKYYINILNERKYTAY